jgi:hypothetical protein
MHCFTHDTDRCSPNYKKELCDFRLSMILLPLSQFILLNKISANMSRVQSRDYQLEMFDMSMKMNIIAVVRLSLDRSLVCPRSKAEQLDANGKRKNLHVCTASIFGRWPLA